MSIIDKLNQRVARSKASDDALLAIAPDPRIVETPDGYLVQLIPQPGPDDLAGRFAQNGISVPSSGRWILLPGSLIWREHAAEIARLKSVLPTLYFGTRQDEPIIQVRATGYEVPETRDTLLGGYGLRRAQQEGR